MKSVRFVCRLSLPMLIGLALLLWADAAWACPNCKDVLAANDAAMTGAVRGYFWSIMLMLCMPFAILCGLGSYFYFLIRRARKTGEGWAPNVYRPAVTQ